MTRGRHDQPVLTGREKAIAEEAADLLKPILAEIDRKLDRIRKTMEALLAELARVSETAARLANRSDSRQAAPPGDQEAEGPR
jgi:hypothetical protein